MSAQEVAVQETQTLMDATPGQIMTNAPLLEQIDSLAKRMATAKNTVPKHLAGNEGDCWAVIMQAVQWRMNPFVVAQKTHVVNGALGYEAQLVTAVVKAAGSIDGHFRYEYEGDGEALRCRVGAVLKGDSEETWGEWLQLSDVKVRNSPLWKTNPKQQFGYLQAKNFIRLYCSEALLGIYTTDELQDAPPMEREVGPQASSLNTSLGGAMPADDAEDAVIVDEPEHTPVLRFNNVAQANLFINNAKTIDELSALVPDLQAFWRQPGNEQFQPEINDNYKHRMQRLTADDAPVADEETA